MKETYYSATEASKDTQIAVSLNGEALKQQTLEILEKIKAVAKVGDSSLVLVGFIDNVIKNRLEQLGYKIKYFGGDPRDSHDGSTTISWN